MNKARQSLTDRQTDRQTDRLLWIDGLKGVFSLLVVCCHLACVFYPGLYNIESSENVFERIWVNTPLNVLTNGNTAVQFFFFASGLLIARNVYLKLQRNKPCTSLLRKYGAFLSITVPAIVFSYLLMELGWMFHQDALALNGKLDFLLDYNNFEPSFVKCILENFVMVFLKGSDYVGPLWTIRFELLGTIITYPLTYFIYGNKQRGIYTYAFVAILLLVVNRNLVAFMFGAAVWDIIGNKNDDFFSRIVSYIEKHSLLKILCLFVGFYLACCNMQTSGIYMPMGVISSYTAVIRAMGIAICVFVIFLTPKLQKVFQSKWLSKLGSVSAYIYAFHWQIILSAGCGLFVIWNDNIEYGTLIAIISLVCIGLSIAVAVMYSVIQKNIREWLSKLNLRRNNDESN